MDVDSAALEEPVTFNSDNLNSKGKRSAANLPVEAEDSLPWCASLLRLCSRTYTDHSRVEKYRPDTLEDVSGHQDILATINKFIDTNVGFSKLFLNAVDQCTASTSSSSVWPTGYWQDVYYFGPRAANIWKQEHAPDGS